MISSVIFPLLFIATVAQRLLELRRSHINQRRMENDHFVRMDSGRSYGSMFAVHLSWFTAIAYEHLLYPRVIPPVIELLSLILFLMAQALRMWTIRTLAGQWNVNIMTPAASNASSCPFVSSGPYHYIRHPNYLAVIVEFFSLPLLAGAPITAMVWSLLNGLVLTQRITEEESYLFQRPGYRETMGSKPRLIPYSQI